MIYKYSKEEQEKVFNNFIKEGKMRVFPSKERKKYIILSYFIKLFESDVVYTEKQVNEIIKNVYADFATIRRYLVDYKILSRTNDCKHYWIEKLQKI